MIKYIALCVTAILFGRVESNFWAELVTCVATLVAYLMIFKVLVWHSFFRAAVSKADRILSGIAGYILLGLFWGCLFMFMGRVYPGSIMNLVAGRATTRAEELYYSFVTITSLGYGDIVPVTPQMKVMALFAGVTGVLFVAIFVSALVGSLVGREKCAGE